MARTKLTPLQWIYGLIRARRGGTTGAASWNTSGTSNTDLTGTAAFIQVGSVAGSATAGTDVAVTFPNVFNQVPIVLATVQSAGGSNQYCTVNTVTTSGFNIRQLTGTTSETLVWVAIGQ